MKYALISVCVVALASVAGLGAQAMDERRETVVAGPEQRTADGQSDLQKSTASPMPEPAQPAPAAQEPETTGLGSPAVERSSSAAAGSAAAQEVPPSAAEVRRVRAAVERTLRRTHESVRTSPASRVPAAVGQTLERTQELFRTASH